jgi:hypothetical protein
VCAFSSPGQLTTVAGLASLKDMELSEEEQAFLRWLDRGAPGFLRRLPARLIDLGLVEMSEDGEPRRRPWPTWGGSVEALRIRVASDDEIGGVAA